MTADPYRDLTVLLYAAARLGVWLAVFAAIFAPIERVFALHAQKIFRKGIAVDLGYYFLTGLLPALVLAPPISAAVLVIHHFIPGGVLTVIAAWPIWLKACATMMVGETAYYWAHRLSHQIPFLWRFHAVHHSAEQLDFLVNTRMHPVDLVWSRMVMLTPIFALGLANPLRFGDGLIATAILLTGSLWGYFIHSNVRWRLGPFEWLVTTPAFHHWHHTNDGRRRDCNYASMFPWLDRVFGTHHLPEAWPERYGIDEPMPDSLAGQFIHPLAPSRPLLPAKDNRVAQL
ncbi:MAG TPA: sterol desaturase family protein [Roseiarcus sp.]|jgi:sterol desaturase/sphingolipid hydroxylase (fatty acid hydroxylase superfamily)